MPITKEAKRVIIIFAVVMLLFVSVLGWLHSQRPGTLTFYWGTTCPHCHNVQRWMESHPETDVLGIKQLEVWDDKDNAAAFVGVARKCGMDQPVVPVLVAENGVCYVGEVEIVDYLKERLNIKEAPVLAAPENNTEGGA
jgi:glutaredoxin